MATGMQPKELGINYLVLCDNTKTQKVSSKSMTMRAKLGGGGYRELLLMIRSKVILSAKFIICDITGR